MEKLDKYQKISLISMIIVISGVFGWIYEFIFYYFDGGMKGFYMQGGNFLPWINIYAIGAVIILILTKKVRNKPILVFLLSLLGTGILEYISGYLILKLFNARYWDYNTEIWNWGNINGFICFRSVFFFGISGLILIYLILPRCKKIVNKFNHKKIMVVSLIILSIFLMDEFYNSFLTRFFELPSAIKIYKALGFRYYK